MADTSTTRARELIIHPSLYFPDGDVVISVDSERTQHLFRVDRVFLTRHSKTFAHMFAIADDPAEPEHYDGIPLIPLYGDDPEGIEGLLRFLYNPASLRFKRHDPSMPVTAYKILQVANKYQIDSVHPLIASQLTADWPTTLDEWLLREDELEVAARQDLAQGAGRGLTDDRFPEPASAIRLALDYNIPAVLPASFYALARIRAREDWERRRGGSKAWRFRSLDVDASDADLARPGVRTARWDLLSKDALYCLVLGKGLLADAELEFEELFVVKSPPQESCTPECAEQRERLVKETWRIGSAPLECPDPLGRLRRWLRVVYSPCGLCPLCMLWLGRRIERTMAKVWEDLPAMFRVDVLLRERALV